MSASFTCQDGNGLDRCFNGGICLNTTTSDHQPIQVCICPDGQPWTGDMEWFHYPNCVRRENSRFAFLIQFGITLWIVALFILREVIWRLKSNAKAIGVLAFAYLQLAFWFLVGIHVQDGCYEACAVLGNLCYMCTFVLLATLIVTIMKPVFMLHKGSFRSFRTCVLAWTGLMIIGAVVVLIFMVKTTRDEDPTSYNNAALASCLILYIASATLALIAIIAAELLRGRLSLASSSRHDSSTQRAKAENLMKRIRILQTGMMIFVVPFLLMTFAVPVTIGVMSYFPYYYVLDYLTYELAICFGLGMLLFLRQNGNINDPSGSKSNDVVPTANMSLKLATSPARTSDVE